ncbi:hypothetical protein F5Y18DRAFT_112010 [Xylariaceae sp. FL1019]|nr:hypothetical protein F5Y18DRAFT_112010 [Xylariaceae sp. FL1019]
MDGDVASPPGSPGATPLQPLSLDRVNQQNPMLSPLRNESQRDSDVHDKIRQFNNLTHLTPANASAMSKQLERKTADAALKRAMVGREEAETEMRRYREESRVLRKQIDEGRERERKVGERLETVMESYGRAKETYSHTQSIWEKEIRRARKETFKSQSSILKLQEEARAAKSDTKSAEERLEREKALSKAREQEAFASRYQLVAVQEELQKALERAKFLEEERDAFKAAAHSEEVARLALEGRLPLPPEEPDTEFASPKKGRESFMGRESLSTFEIRSSAASEAELEELTRLWQWEKQRADRTQEHLEFVEAESRMRSKSHSTKSQSTMTSPRREHRPSPIKIVDPADLMILGAKAKSLSPKEFEAPDVIEQAEPHPTEDQSEDQSEAVKEESIVQTEPEEPRRGTIFLPAEGIFRTISEQDLKAMEDNDEVTLEPPTPVEPCNPHHARTPSLDPPSFALMAQERTSLLSLLNAPRQSDSHCGFEIPTTTAEEVEPECAIEEEDASSETPQPPSHRPHTSAAFYTVTTTTSIPVHDENVKSHTVPLIGQGHGGRTPSFDVNNPALTPTMSREEALQQIKERRGRARSAMQGAMTPRKQMVVGAGERRDVSAPAGRAAKGRT